MSIETLDNPTALPTLWLNKYILLQEILAVGQYTGSGEIKSIFMLPVTVTIHF